jgi:hypothetical protein
MSSAKIITYCKWLIYTAPFKDIDFELHMQIHKDFYLTKLANIQASDDQPGTCHTSAVGPLSKKRHETKSNPRDYSDQELVGANNELPNFAQCCLILKQMVMLTIGRVMAIATVATETANK